MKRLFYISLALVLITTAGCKRKSRSERLYERYLNDSNRVEFVTPSADTVIVEEEVEVEEPVARAMQNSSRSCRVRTSRKKTPKTRRKANSLSRYSR